MANSDDFDPVVLIVAIVGGLVFMCGILGCMCWRSKKHWKTIELRAPLITEAASRADEALEAAQKGSATCAQCGFANFAHVTICVVCGGAVGDDATRKKTLKRRKTTLPHG
jgi:hypothetical protein